MKHPSEATLALFASGDLGLLGRWQARRHLAGCPSCRIVVEQFAGIREEIPGLRALPGVAWNRLAAEMRANIRLGLEAGQCVGDGPSDLLTGQPSFPGWRVLAASVSLMVLAGAGFVLQRPVPVPATSAEGTVLRATLNGIELSEAGQAMTLLHRRARQQEQEVTYLVGAQGSLAARYVDAETGYVTVNNVYDQ